MTYFNLVKKEGYWQLVKFSDEGKFPIAFAPSEYLHLMQINLPTSSKNQLQKAIPYAIEPELAQPIDTVHFVVGEQEQKNLSVCVIDKSLMKLWQNVCQREDANLLLLPDIFKLPYEPNAWTLLKQENRYVVRTGYSQGLVVFQLAHLSILLQQDPVAIEKIISFDAGDLAHLNYLIEERDFDTREILDTNYIALKDFNLLQGEFALTKESQSSVFNWKASFYLMLLLVLVWGIGEGLQAIILSKHKADLDQKIEKIYHHYFPDSAEVIDPELRLKHLTNQKGSYDPYYLKVLLAIQQVVKAHPAIHIEKLDYTKNKMLITFAGEDEHFYSLLQQRLAPLGKINEEKPNISVEWEA